MDFDDLPFKDEPSNGKELTEEEIEKIEEAADRFYESLTSIPDVSWKRK